MDAIRYIYVRSHENQNVDWRDFTLESKRQTSFRIKLAIKNVDICPFYTRIKKSQNGREQSGID